LVLKILAGDFPQNSYVTLETGWSGKPKALKMPRGWWRTTSYGIRHIVSVQQVDQQNSTSILGKAGWGAVGAIALGPLGLLAGVLGGGNRSSTILAVEFSDGKRALLQGKSKEMTQVLALGFGSA
jgi:hypothetical protein